MKKVWITTVFTIIVLLQFGCMTINSPKEQDNKLNIAAAQRLDTEEAQGAQFLQTKLTNTDGLIYYLVERQSGAAYSVLESMGQAMEYAALSGNRELFLKYAQSMEKHFRDPGGYYYWKIDVATGKGETASALVDDVRLAKAYFIAHEKGLGDFSSQIYQLSEIIYQFDVNDNGYPCDYFEGDTQKKAGHVSLFYLDVGTFEKLAKVNAKWLKPHENAKKILRSMPENKHGFYPKTFELDIQKYVWGDTVNMVENLYTALDAQAAGRNTRPLAAFLKKQIRNGKIFNHYHANGKPDGDDESVAVYALAVRFLLNNGEQEAAEQCYRRMSEFQIKSQDSFAGGFGDEDNGLVYAFDHLEALLMMRMVK